VPELRSAESREAADFELSSGAARVLHVDVDQHGPEVRDGGGRHPVLVSSLGWRALWAPLLGVWGVFPHLLRTQRVHPASADEWWLLTTLALTIFLAFGVVGALATWRILRSWTTLRKRPLSDPGWASALCVPLVLPLLYFLAVACTELTFFRSLVGLGSYRPFFGIACGSYLLVAPLSWWLYRAVLRCNPRRRLTPLTLSGVLALAAGLILAPICGEPAFDAKTAVQQAQPLSDGARPRAPLLFVGVDSGSWKILQPLLDRGRAPTRNLQTWSSWPITEAGLARESRLQRCALSERRNFRRRQPEHITPEGVNSHFLI